MRRAAWLLFPLLGSACALDVPPVPDPSHIGEQCLPANPDRPNCNGLRRRDECAALGLPSVYGVDTGCRAPVLPNGSECDRRRQGLYLCQQSGNLTCCNK